jgi:hypothetical protein
MGGEAGGFVRCPERARGERMSATDAIIQACSLVGLVYSVLSIVASVRHVYSLRAVRWSSWMSFPGYCLDEISLFDCCLFAVCCLFFHFR